MSRSIRRRSVWIVLAGFMIALIGVMAWSVVVAARAFHALAEIAVAAALASLLEGITYAVYLMIVQEILVAAIVWITRGPGWAFAWIGWRISIWQGP